MIGKNCVEYPIDIVITWVDGNDPKWIEEKNKYKPNKNNSNNRYRDWELLKYWFRSIEKNASWVNKIYFVTYGHYPKWLNLSCEKLVIVKHEDYLNKKWLPTFNARTINLNFNKIKELSEHFVYFDDDMFLLKPVKRDFFFKQGKPCLLPLLKSILPADDETFFTALFNNTYLINKSFDFQKSLGDNKTKWFSISKLGLKNVIINLFNSKYSYFPGFGDDHLPVPMKKSTLNDVWNTYGKMLENSSEKKFRTANDLNQFIFRYWQLAKGDFEPKNTYKTGKYLEITDDSYIEVCDYIKQRKKTLICINDECENDSEIIKEKLQISFESLFPEKSKFEV